MPTISHVTEDRYQCGRDGCAAERTPSSSVDGAYCSRECADRAHGRALLNDIEQDHRFCFVCFRQRKDVEPVPDEARRGKGRHTAEALIGFESLTRHSERGPYGIECTCGSIDHDTPDWGQRDRTPYHWFLTLASEQLVADGRREDSIDIVTLVDHVYKTDDLELAIGRALRA